MRILYAAELPDRCEDQKGIAQTVSQFEIFFRGFFVKNSG